MNTSATRFGVRLAIVAGLTVALLVTCGAVAWAATSYTWNGGASASWAVAASWSPSRDTPATDDILVFNSGGTVTATAVPTQTIGQLLISGNTYVYLQAALTGNTLTVNGGTGTDFGVPAGSTLELNTVNVLTIALSASATGTVGGTINARGAGHKITAAGTGALVFQSGSRINLLAGFASNVFGNVTANSVKFESGSLYTQKAGANPFALAQPASVVTFETGSFFRWDTSATSYSPAASGRTYADFEFNGVGGIATAVTGGSPVSIDNLTVSQGTFNFNMTGTASVIKGNILVKPGATMTFSPASAATVTLSGSSAQAVTNNGTLAFTANQGITIGNTSGVTLMSPVTLLGTLKINPGGSLSGTAPGYGSSATLVYARGMSTGIEWGSSGAPPNVKIDAGSGNSVTLSGSRTVSGALTFTSGKVATGSNTLTIGSSGSISGAGSGTGWVEGNLQKNVSSAGAMTFEIGDASTYTPVALNFSTVSTAGDLAVRTTSGDHPQIGSSGLNSSKSVNRYWSFTNSGIAGTYDATFNFVSGDIDGGANTSNFLVKRYDSGSWFSPTVGARTSTSTQATGLTSFSDFAIGEPGQLPTTTTLASSPNPSVSGASVTLMATVSPSAATGTVTFYDGVSSLGPATLSGGTATLSVSTLTVGSHSLTASYGGDATYAGSVSSPVTHDVAPGPTTYVWNGATSDWTVSTNWTPTRTTPLQNDILQFNGSATVTNVPTETVGELDLSNSASVSLDGGATGNTLTLGYASATALSVPAGCTLTTPNTSRQPLLIVRPGATATIAGAMSWGAVITNNGAFSVGGTGTLTMYVPFVNNGACNVDGTFLLWTNNADATGNAFTYGSSATLAFKSPPSSPHAVYGNAYWPATNGPLNVSVLYNGNAQGGITMKVPRTVTGLFLTAATVSLDGGSLRLEGTVQINMTGSGPGTFANAPTYGPSSTLRYMAGPGNYLCGAEWSSDSISTPGCPVNVQISNNTTLDLGHNGTGLARKCSGNLTIDSGSGLSMNLSPMTAPLTVLGNLDLAGTLELSSVAGGDFRLAGNWTRTTGTFTPNGRPVSLTGSNQVTITATGGETFYSLAEDKPAGGVQLASDVTISGTSGDVLAIQNVGGMDLQGHTLTFTGAGGNLRGYGYTGSISSSTGPATIVFNGAKTLVGTDTAPTAAAAARPDVALQMQMVEEIVSQGRGFVLREVAVPTQVAAPTDVQGTGGLDFGGTLILQVNAPLTFPATGVATVRGTLQLNSGGSVTNKPVYAGSATLVYNTPSGFTVGGEWGGTASTVGLGVPSNVTVQAGNITMPAASRNVPGALQLLTGTLTMNSSLSAKGDVTIAEGAALDLNDKQFTYYGAALTNNGSIVGPVLTKPNSSLMLRPNGPVSYTGTGTAGTASDPIAHVYFLGLSTARTITLDPSSTINANHLWLALANLVNSNRLVIGRGGSAPTTVQIGNSNTSPPAGGFDVTPTYNLGTGGLQLLYAGETGVRTMGPEIPASRQLYGLACAVAGGVQLAGGNLAVSSWVDLNNGPFKIGAGNKVTMGPGGSIGALAPGNLATGADGGTIEFAGAGTANDVTFNQVTLAGGAVDFGTTCTVNGVMHLAGGSVGGGHPPIYATGSTLRYETSYAIGDEWLAGTSGPGVPYNVEVASGTLDFNPAASSTPRTALGGVTVGSGAGLTLGGSAGGDLSVAGDWTNSGTVTTNGRAVNLNGSSTQTVAGGGTFDVLTITGVDGVTLASDVTVSLQLLLNGGNLVTGPNKVVMASGATVTRTSGHVFGRLQKTVPTGPGVPLTFEIGDAAAYAPVALMFDNVGTAGPLMATTTAGDHPDLAGSSIDQAHTANRYWTLSNSGVAFDHCAATFNFATGDLDPSTDPAKFAVGKHDPGGWTYPAVGTRTITSTEATGLTSFSEFALGELSGHTITASAGAGGSISPSGAVLVTDGASQAFAITPDPDYVIGTVLVDGSSVGAVSAYTFVNVTSDHTISAAFVSAGTVSVGPVPGPITLGNPIVTVPVRITRSSSSPALMAFSVVFTVSSPLSLPNGRLSITLPSGGGFLNVDGGRTTSLQTVDRTAGVYQADGTTLGPPCGSTALTGTLFNIALSSSELGGSGTITINSVQLRDCSNGSIEAAVGTGGTVLVDRSPPSVAVTAPNGGEIWHVNSPQTITWDADDPEGVASVDLAYSTDGGSNYTPIATGLPNTGTCAWTIPATPSATARVRAIAHDANGNTATDVSDGNFTIAYYTIVATAGDHGSISPPGTTNLAYGGSQAYTIAPATACHIVDVKVDNVTQGAIGSYTFTNVTADHTIAASFDENPAVPKPELTVTQVRSGNTPGNTCTVAITWPALPAGSSMEIWRYAYGHYPEYHHGGAPPAQPTGDPPAGWTEVTAVVQSGDTDDPGTRDYWYYVGYVTDQYGTRSVVSDMKGAPDYFLGDVSDGSTPGHGDNLVQTEDISLLGSHYGISLTLGDEFNYLDVGPTSTGWVDGLPLPDDVIEFEDLVIFALNYGTVSAPQAAARPVAAASSGGELVLERPEKVTPDGPVAATLTLRGSGGLRAISTKLAWDAAVVEPVGHTAGEWLTSQGGVAFSAKPGTVDAAVLQAQGMKGEGLLATMTFKVVAAGDPKIRIEAVDGRDGGNRKVTLGQVERLLAPALPTVTQLAFTQPNPFRETAAIAFSLAQRGAVELAIYSVDGRRVRTLVNEVREPGEYRQGWDGRDDRGNLSSAGVYYARLASGKIRIARTIVYLK